MSRKSAGGRNVTEPENVVVSAICIRESARAGFSKISRGIDRRALTGTEMLGFLALVLFALGVVHVRL